MKQTLTALVLGGLLLLAMGPSSAALAEASEPARSSEQGRELDGKALFVEVHKCNMCHAVPAAEIPAKAKSEKMRGPEFRGKPAGDFSSIAAFVRKKSEKDDALHKKEFKGSDEELQAIIDWLASLEE